MHKTLTQLHRGQSVTIRGVTVQKVDGDVNEGDLCVEADWHLGRLHLGHSKRAAAATSDLIPVRELGRILFC